MKFDPTFRLDTIVIFISFLLTIGMFYQRTEDTRKELGEMKKDIAFIELQNTQAHIEFTKLLATVNATIQTHMNSKP